MRMRWFRGPWWKWPWPHWFFFERRLWLAWCHLPRERRDAYLRRWHLMETAEQMDLVSTEANRPPSP